MYITIEATNQQVVAVSSTLSKICFFDPERNDDISSDFVAEHLVYTAIEKLSCDLEGLWQHYKGGLYLFLGLAIDISDKSQYVLYCSTSDVNKIWARPLQEFVGKLEVKNGVVAGDNKEFVKRFTKVKI